VPEDPERGRQLGCQAVLVLDGARSGPVTSGRPYQLVQLVARVKAGVLIA
jgi:hypothetical protein